MIKFALIALLLLIPASAENVTVKDQVFTFEAKEPHRVENTADGIWIKTLDGNAIVIHDELEEGEHWIFLGRDEAKQCRLYVDQEGNFRTLCPDYWVFSSMNISDTMDFLDSLTVRGS